MAKNKDGVPADIAKMSFEDALAELEDIVRALEDGSGPLDQAIGSYERGAHLRKHCAAKLKQAEARIEKITIDADGALAVEPLDPE